MFKYTTVVLFSLCLIFGVSAYRLSKEVGRLEDSVEKYSQIATDNANAVENLKSSCEVTEKITKDNRDAIDALEKDREATLGALSSLPSTTLPETKLDGKEEASGPPKAFSDDSRLSPALMQLLDNAYCSGSKDSSSCTAR